MGIAPGFGYGAALAADELPGAALRGRRIGEEHELKERQMDVNEAAEERAGQFYGVLGDTYKQANSAALGGAAATVVAQDAGLNGQNPTGKPVAQTLDPTQPMPSAAGGYGMASPTGTAPTPVTPPDNTTKADQGTPAETPKYGATGADAVDSAMGNKAMGSLDPTMFDASGIPFHNAMGDPLRYDPQTQTFTNIATGDRDQPALMPEVKNAMVAEERGSGGGGGGGSVKSGGAQGGGVLKTGSRPPVGAGVAAPKASALSATPAGAMNPAELQATVTGKAQPAPQEGDGMIAAARNLRANADAAGVRLQEALKTVDQQYGGDPVLATFTKANLINQVNGNIAQMRNNAEIFEHQGVMANHMQLGSKVASQIMGHVMKPGGVVDQDFLDSMKPDLEKLGFDPAMLMGTHAQRDGKGNPTGYIVNGTGAVVPMKTFMMVANGALPWEVRANAWKEMHDEHIQQQKFQLEWAKVRNQDPTLLPDYFFQSMKRVQQGYENADNKWRQAWSLLGAGQPVNIGTPDKPKMVTVPNPSQYKGEGSLESMATSQDPNTRAVGDYLRGLGTDRRTFDVFGQMLQGMGKTAMHYKDVGVAHEARDLERPYAESDAEDKAYGLATGKREGETPPKK